MLKKLTRYRLFEGIAMMSQAFRSKKLITKEVETLKTWMEEVN